MVSLFLAERLIHGKLSRYYHIQQKNFHVRIVIFNNTNMEKYLLKSPCSYANKLDREKQGEIKACTRFKTYGLDPTGITK